MLKGALRPPLRVEYELELSKRAAILSIVSKAQYFPFLHILRENFTLQARY